MVSLTWSRTVIGGKTAPYDFHARDGEIDVGRIYWDKGTSHSGPYWFWAMQAWGPGINRHGILCSSTVPTKEEAVAAVARAWEKCREK